MRVLAFCDYFGSSSTGGAEKVAEEIYARLARDHGCDVTVVGGDADRVDPTNEAIGVHIEMVRGRDLSRALGSQMLVSPSLTRHARRVVDAFAPDVIHINGLHFHSSLVGIRLARRLRLPVVTTAHLAAVDAMPSRLPMANTTFDRVAGGRVLAGSQRIVAVSQAVARHVESIGADPADVVVAPNGVDRSEFFPSLARTSRPFLQLILVGRLIGTKGPLLALDAVGLSRASGRDVRIEIVGDGPLRSAVETRSQRDDLAGAVQVTGSVSDVGRRLRTSDVALRPSYSEGLPLGVLEALATARPVIVSDVPGNLELVTHEHNGLVVPAGDAEALSVAINRVYDDRALLSQLTASALDSVRWASWEGSARIHADTLRSVAPMASARR